jgi:iron complex outermembrane receptor protein
MACRYENYNAFGNNLAGKLAMRYKLSSAISLRGSISNGYHAPTLQQIYFSSTGSTWQKVGGMNVPVQLGTFSNNSTVAQAFGIKPLQPEKAVNLGGGFTSTLSPHINLLVDAYWIQIKNRIVLSGRFDKTNPDVNRILQSTPGVDQVQFFTNAINTRTRGIDIVMNGKWNIHKSGLALMLAANFSRTNIFGPIQTTDKLPADSLNTNTLFDREQRAKIENSQPGSKIILSANYKRGKMEFLIRNTRFGKTSAVFNAANISQDEFYSAKILTDLSISYTPKIWVTISTGANNIFDVYPDKVINPLNKNEGILIYGNEAMPFGFNGGYYFVNMEFKL